jgi:shikimate kinase
MGYLGVISMIGMPGSGKSTVGRQLARQLGSRFVDSDTEIEKRIGMPIRTYFETEGEGRFRDLEQSVLADLLQGDRLVLATGGGIVLREDNRRSLREASTAIYLRSSPEELFRRLRHDTHRPLLQVGDPLRKLRELSRERDSLYRQTAHFVVEIGRPSLATLLNMILMQLELAGIVDPSLVPSPVEPRRDQPG